MEQTINLFRLRSRLSHFGQTYSKVPEPYPNLTQGFIFKVAEQKYHYAPYNNSEIDMNTKDVDCEVQLNKDDCPCLFLHLPSQ
jgi:hypothetical protein